MAKPKYDTPMLAVYAGQTCVGHIYQRSKAGFEAFNTDGLTKSILEQRRTEMQCDDLKEYEAWLVTRKAAGEAIDIATCKFMWQHVQVLDPYGYRRAAGTFSEEEDCIGRDYFVCSENSDGWIWYGDLPKEKKHALDGRIKREASDEHWIFGEAD